MEKCSIKYKKNQCIYKNIKISCCCRPGYFSHFPPLVNVMEILVQRFGWPPKPNALDFCRRNTLCLPLPDVGALVLCHKRQHLQHNVTEEGSQQILASPCIQKRHIQHHNVNAFFLCAKAPLLQYFCVIASQKVDVCLSIKKSCKRAPKK